MSWQSRPKLTELKDHNVFINSTWSNQRRIRNRQRLINALYTNNSTHCLFLSQIKRDTEVSFLYSVFKKVCPKGIFFIEYLFLFRCQFVRIIGKHVEYRFLVKTEKPFADRIRIFNPPNHVGRVVFIEFIWLLHLTPSFKFWGFNRSHHLCIWSCCFGFFQKQIFPWLQAFHDYRLEILCTFVIVYPCISQ